MIDKPRLLEIMDYAIKGDEVARQKIETALVQFINDPAITARFEQIKPWFPTQKVIVS